MRLLIGIPLVVLALVALLPIAMALMPTRWLVERIESLVLGKTGYTVSIGELELHPFGLHPSVRLLDVDVDGREQTALVRHADLDGTIALLPLLRAEVLIERVRLGDAEVLVRRDAGGANTWSSADIDAKPKPDATRPELPDIGELVVEDTTLRLDDEVSGHEASLALHARGSTRARPATFELRAGGEVDGVRTDLSLALTSLAETPSLDAGVELVLDASLGAVDVDLEGTVGDVAALRDIDLEATLAAQDLTALETLLGRKLPALAPLRFETAVLDEGGELIARRFHLTAPPVVAEGDVRFDRDGAPPTLYANLIVSRLDLDASLAAFGTRAGDAADASAAGSSGTTPAANARVLSDAPLPLADLFTTVRGAIDLDVEGVLAESLPIDGIVARIELEPSRMTLALKEASVAGGDASGTVTLAPTIGADGDAGVVPVDATVALELARVDVGRLLKEIGLPEATIVRGGRLGGEMKLWAEGESVADLAGSLDGGAVLLMNGGTISALADALAGLDVLQGLGDALMPGEQTLPIRCAYLDLQAESGRVEIDKLIVDTADTVFLGDGTVDLGSERLALTFEPHRKHPTLLSAGTAVGIDGSFAAPEVDVGRSLLERAAVVLLLSETADPALALLPLIEIGGATDPPFCSKLAGALDP